MATSSHTCLCQKDKSLFSGKHAADDVLMAFDEASAIPDEWCADIRAT